MPTYAYDAAFFAYTTDHNDYAAARISALLFGWLQPRSVVDFGCAHGAWLAAWRAAGATELCGLDGDYVDRARLRIDPACFHATDLARPVELGRRFDLAQSVEVAEHLPADAARDFVRSLCRHAEVVLFSAAPPGQGGEHHVNERPYDYWRAEFEALGYACYDCVRPALAGDGRVPPWYRYNVLLFASQDGAARLPASVTATRIGAGVPVPDVAPPLYRARRAVVAMLPAAVADRLARAKARIAQRLRVRP